MISEPQTITAKAWLHMLANGRYTCTELAEIVGSARKQMENLLFQMVDRGYAKRYKDDGRKNGTAYGVTATCRVPGGVPLADILFAAREQTRTPQQMTTPQDRMRPAAMPDWQSAADDHRIPRVVPGWTPPKMTPPRATA